MLKKIRKAPKKVAKAIHKNHKKLIPGKQKAEKLAGKLTESKSKLETQNKSSEKLHGKEADSTKLSEEAQENGAKGTEEGNSRITELSKALEEALAQNLELEEQLKEKEPKAGEAAAEEAPAAAEAAPAAAPAGGPAPAHGAAPMGQAPKMDINMELQALSGQVFAAQMSGQDSGQSQMQLSTKYQQAGGEGSKNISPQTKQMVAAALGQGQGMGGMMNAMSGLFGQQGMFGSNNGNGSPMSLVVNPSFGGVQQRGHAHF